MILHETLNNNIDNPLFLELLRKGVIPLSVLNYKVYYEMYLHELNKGEGKMQAVENVCQEYKISQATVYRSRNLMTS